MRHINPKKIAKTWWYWIPCVFMTLLIFGFYSSFLNPLNPDLQSYFSIAQHYRDFYFVEAFNSYWSPMISWLLAFFPNLDTKPLTAFRWINIAVAFATYHQLYFWLRLVLHHNVNRFIAATFMATLFAHLALCIGSPDFLSLFFFLLFLKVLIRRNHSLKHGLIIVGAIVLCFFSKTFLFMLCLGVLFVVVGYDFLLNKKLLYIRFLVFITLCLGIILFAWASCLKMHYGYYTLSSTFKINAAVPSHEPLSLLPPATPHSLFAWEDPQRIQTKLIYSGGISDILKQQVKRWAYNWNITIYYFRYISYLQIWILLIPLIGLFYFKQKRFRIYGLLFAVFAINWFGYFSIVMQERYLIIGQVCLSLCVMGITETIGNRWLRNVRQKSLVVSSAIFFLFICMVKNPIQESMREYEHFAFLDFELKEAETLAASGVLKGKSIATYLGDQMLCNRIVMACYLGGGKNFGEIDPAITPEEQQKEMRKHNLDLVVNGQCAPQFCRNKEWLKKRKIVFQTGEYSIVEASKD